MIILDVITLGNMYDKFIAGVSAFIMILLGIISYLIKEKNTKFVLKIDQLEKDITLVKADSVLAENEVKAIKELISDIPSMKQAQVEMTIRYEYINKSITELNEKMAESTKITQEVLNLLKHDKNKFD